MHIQHRKLPLVLSAAAALLLGGCATDMAMPKEDISALQAKQSHPAHYSSSYISGKVQDNWLRTFRDKTLNRLVNEAQQHNPDIKIAAERITRAEAIMHYTQTAMVPQLNLQGSYTQQSWEAQGKHGRGNIVLALNWEPDIWGKISHQTKRDAFTMEAQSAYYTWARESLAANTAKLWFLVASDRMIYEFANQVVAIQSEAQHILDQRAKIGQGNMRDVHMSRAMVAEAKETRTAALSAKERDTRALEVLVGRYPANALHAKRLPPVPARVPSGIPADLLNRRPDIIAAQYQVAAAFHNTKAVELLRLPRITLSGQAGVDVIQDTMAKLIGGLFMPIFDAGAIQAQIDAASAEQKIAIENYRNTVLNAYEEVENALALEGQLASRYAYISTMVKEYKTTYDMTKANYEIGQGTYIDVLTVQAKWISAQIQKLQIHKARLLNRVNLHLALGGSFNTSGNQSVEKGK